MLLLENKILISKPYQRSVDLSVCLYDGDYVVKNLAAPRRYDKGISIKAPGFLS